MFNLIVFILSATIAIYFINSVKSIKTESFKNKILFIDEFKKSELNTHPYTDNNYIAVKKWTESKYPAINYIKEQDTIYTQCLFREEKTSSKYNYALSGKHDIAILKQEIEFDTLRECFTQICKNDINCKNNSFLSRNKNLIFLFTQSIIFTKKIATHFTCIQVSLIIAIIFFIRILLDIM